MRCRLLALALFVTMIAAPAHAEGPEFEMREFYGACLEGKCMKAAQFVLRNLRKESEEPEFLNAQYGYVALAAFQAARRTDSRRDMVQVAAVLRGLARLSTIENQSNAFGRVSRAILSGDRDIFEYENPFVASPTGGAQDNRRKVAQLRRAQVVRELRERRRAALERLRQRRQRS